jgi:two-component system NtrC family sensor kinase
MKTHLCKYYLIPFFLILSVIVIAQNDKIDSLKKVLQSEKEDTNKVKNLNQLSQSLLNNHDNNNSLQAAKDASSLAEKIDDKKGMAASKFRQGVAEWHMGKFDDALASFQMDLTLYENIGDKKHVGAVYEEISIIYYAKGLFGEAINSIYNGLKIYEEIGDKNAAANCFQDIGSFYIKEGNDTESLKNLFMALKLRRELKDSNYIAQTEGTISVDYANRGDYTEALKADSEAFNIYTQLGPRSYSWGIAFCKSNFGGIYKKLGDKADAQSEHKKATDDYQQSLENYNYAFKFWMDKKDYDNVEPIDNKIGFVQIRLHHFSEAKKCFLDALKLSEALPIKEEIENSYNGLSIIDSASGNYKQAYEYYKKYITYRDSIINEKSTKKSMQASMQYDFAKKEAIAKAEQYKKDERAKRIKNQQYFIIAGLGVVILAVLTIALIQFRNNKQKKKANLLLQNEKQKVESTLSELRSAQSQLIQSEKMASLGELTAGIAHEIQNPLNFVNNFSDVNAELIDEANQEIDKGNTSEAKIILKDIKENEEKINHHGKRADAIVKGMLQHSRTSTGLKEPTDINVLADEYLRLSYHGFRAKDNSFNARMETDFDGSIEKINIIPQDIGRVLLNLYNNAFYAVNEKKKQIGESYEPTISVSTKKSGNQVSIGVSDNGNGIPQKIVDKIFQPFFTTKPTGQGTGLGLSLSYDIVKAHGGEIKVNTKENEGSEFIIELPLR